MQVILHAVFLTAARASGLGTVERRHAVVEELSWPEEAIGITSDLRRDYEFERWADGSNDPCSQ